MEFSIRMSISHTVIAVWTMALRRHCFAGDVGMVNFNMPLRVERPRRTLGMAELASKSERLNSSSRCFPSY